MRRLLLCVAATAITACPREHVSDPLPVAHELDAAPASPRFTAKLPPFVEALGKSPRVSPAEPGAYAGALKMERSKIPTMEISIDDDATGRATLTLADDGTANGCFASRWSHRRAESHYSTKSGKDESTTEKGRTFVGARGNWSRGSGGWLDVHFDATAKDACPAPSPLAPQNSYGSFALRCLRIEPNDALPTPVLACTAGDADWPVHDLLVPLARDVPRDWLVLADAAVGVAVDCDFGRRVGLSPGPEPSAEPKITFVKTPVTLTPSAWLKD